MKKYSQASFVVIGFDLVQNIKISYSDNGIGFDKNLILKNGLQNVKTVFMPLMETLLLKPNQIKVFERQFHYQNNRPCLQKY
jgi:hypothetical protein